MSSANNNGSGSAHDDAGTGSQGGGSGAGFKVYGSVFKVDARYELLNPLGKGSYGVVCAAKDRETGQRMAIKKVCPMAKRSVDAKHTLREVLLLQLLGKHPNVISIHNLSTNLKDDELYIVMDLMDTDLHRVIQSSQTLSDSHVKYFLHQLLRGVKYLHDNGVLHRDLKPGNLLLTKTCQLKIADFGLARKALKQTSTTSSSSASSGTERPRSAPAMSSASRGHVDRAPMTEHVVTRWYRAPELMLQPDGFYGESVDMWSVGCIFAEILGRKALFPGKNFLHQLTLIFDVIGTPPTEATAKIKSSQAQRFLKSLGKKPKVPFSTVFPNASDEALDLLERLLEFDPEKRISAQDALAHPYMQPIEKKYKGVDPYPSARVDFSFDTKKLTKMDLRALIIKEVDSFRRSVAHTAAIDSEVVAESGNSNSNSTGGVAAAKPPASQPHEREKKRPASASAVSHMSGSSSSAASGGRVMCGSAGISMIHSVMRQRLASEQANADSSSGVDPAAASTTGFASTTKTGTPATVSVTIGSNRPRIRMVTKPPVPKQPPLAFGAPAGESQGHVRVVSTQEPRSFLVSSEASEETTAHPAVEETRLRQAEDVACPKTVAAPIAGAATTAVSFTRVPSDSKHTDSEERDAKKSDTAKAAASAFTALEQRSKALMKTNEALSSQWAAPVTSLLVGRANVLSSKPETSHSPSSPAKSPAMSSSSTSSSDSDTERRRMAAFEPQRTGNLTARAAPTSGEPLAGPVRRRVASAGPMRQKPAPTLSAAIAQKQAGGHTTFVGSTTSLIRAQRTSNGQSLADSADQMVANMAAKREEQREPRDESGGGPELKNQRSMTQLNQLDAGVKKPSKKLTVPKSPKFSVMSWQKKKDMAASARARMDPGAGAGHVIPRR